MYSGRSNNCNSKMRIWNTELHHCRNNSQVFKIKTGKNNTEKKVKELLGGREQCRYLQRGRPSLGELIGNWKSRLLIYKIRYLKLGRSIKLNWIKKRLRLGSVRLKLGRSFRKRYLCWKKKSHNLISRTVSLIHNWSTINKNKDILLKGIINMRNNWLKLWENLEVKFNLWLYKSMNFNLKMSMKKSKLKEKKLTFY